MSYDGFIKRNVARVASLLQGAAHYGETGTLIVRRQLKGEVDGDLAADIVTSWAHIHARHENSRRGMVFKSLDDYWKAVTEEEVEDPSQLDQRILQLTQKTTSPPFFVRLKMWAAGKTVHNAKHRRNVFSKAPSGESQRLINLITRIHETHIPQTFIRTASKSTVQFTRQALNVLAAASAKAWELSGKISMPSFETQSALTTAHPLIDRYSRIALEIAHHRIGDLTTAEDQQAFAAGLLQAAGYDVPNAPEPGSWAEYISGKTFERYSAMIEDLHPQEMYLLREAIRQAAAPAIGMPPEQLAPAAGEARLSTSEQLLRDALGDSLRAVDVTDLDNALVVEETPLAEIVDTVDDRGAPSRMHPYDQATIVTDESTTQESDSARTARPGRRRPNPKMTTEDRGPRHRRGTARHEDPTHEQGRSRAEDQYEGAVVDESGVGVDQQSALTRSSHVDPHDEGPPQELLLDDPFAEQDPTKGRFEQLFARAEAVESRTRNGDQNITEPRPPARRGYLTRESGGSTVPRTTVGRRRLDLGSQSPSRTPDSDQSEDREVLEGELLGPDDRSVPPFSPMTLERAVDAERDREQEPAPTQVIDAVGHEIS